MKTVIHAEIGCLLCDVCRENMVMDSLYGFAVVSCTLVAFISLVWLREQILLGGGPDWLERNGVAANNNRVGGHRLQGAGSVLHSGVFHLSYAFQSVNGSVL